MMFGNNKKNIAIFASLPHAFYQSSMCNELSKLGNKKGFNVVSFCNFGAYDTSNVEYAVGERSVVDIPDFSKFDGVFLLSDCMDVPGMLETIDERLAEYPDLPVISIRRRMDNHYNVILDERHAMDVVYDHLLGYHSLKRVFYVSGTPGREDAEKRLECYRSKMDEFGIPYEEDWIFHGNFWTTMGPQMVEWLEEKGMPEAVVCANDYMAISLIQELQTRGYKIPEDVIITGFDDIDKAVINTVSLTTVRVSPYTLAQKTMEVFERILAGEKVEINNYIGGELVVRDSCGCSKRLSDDYAQMGYNMYFKYEDTVINNEVFMYFSRSSQSKKDIETIMRTAAYHNSMLGEYKDLHFVVNNSLDKKKFDDKATYKYRIKNANELEIYDVVFERGDLLPLEANDTPQRYYVMPVHFDDKLFGYACLDTGDDVAMSSVCTSFLVSVANNIERIYQEEKVRELVEREKEARIIAEKASSMKDDFLINLSHEVRTPLNTIMGFCNMLFDENLSEEGFEYLTSIRYAGNNLLRMIGDILDYCQLSAGGFKLHRKRYNSMALKEAIEHMMEMFCRGKEIVYSVSIAKDVPPKLIGDRERIEQILVNLCSNAAKYTKKGRIKASIRWQPESKDSGNLILAVMDTGIGIRKEDMEVIFDSFKQLDAARNRSNEGAGMGLTVCNMLVKTMGGTITIDSIVGKGSCFTVKIPQDIGVVGESVARRPKPNNSKHIDGVSGSKILIVDDNQMNLKVEGVLLSKYGVNVLKAMSGQEAIDILDADNSISLVFMDYMMPEMDGAEATRIIRSKGNDIPIIAVTANTISGATDIYYEAGMSDYLPKPIDIHRMEDILRKWIVGSDV